MLIWDLESGSPGPGTFPARSTSRAELDATIESDRQKVSKNPGDGAAAVQLADALMRAARVKGDASLASKRNTSFEQRSSTRRPTTSHVAC